MSVEILVVGAGPAGLVMAAELARYGVSVRLVEREAAPAQQSRALFLWSRTLELLDRAGAGAALVAAGRKIEALNIRSAGKLIGRADFADISSPHPYALMLPQAETERLLTAHLAACGVAVERGTALEGFSNGENGVTARLRHADGTSEIVEAAYLVGCDGGGSLVRKTLGLSSSGAARQSQWVMADARLEGFAGEPAELTTFWHEDGFLGIFPLPDGLFRVIAEQQDGPGGYRTPDLAEIQLILDLRSDGGITIADPVWLSAYPLQERNASAYNVGRVFLAGDAAHLHNPIGAQGMNMGIQDAVNLAWKLALAQHGVGNAPALLASYDSERRGVAEQVVTNIGRAATVGEVRNPTLQFARNLFGNIFFGFAPARRALAEMVSEVSFGYRHSPLNGVADHALPGPGPGDRMPPSTYQDGFGAGKLPRFTLLGDRSLALEALRETYADLLEPEWRAPLSPRCVWLVRPDGYVAAVALDTDVKLIEACLAPYATSAADAAVM